MAQTAEILEALPPAQAQPAGLALLDLNVTATPLVITWDKDAVSTLLDTVLAQYAGLEVQEADVPAIKNEMAGLNRLKERMDNARKDIKRRIAGPLDGFDAEVKALIARIVDVKPAEPRPDSFIEQEEGFPFAPPVNVACTLTLSVKYAPKYEDTVQEALALLRTVGVVTVF